MTIEYRDTAADTPTVILTECPFCPYRFGEREHRASHLWDCEGAPREIDYSYLSTHD